MEKIFDLEVERYLLETGVSQKDINKIKYQKYKEGMLYLAKKLTKAIEQEDAEIIKPHLAYSSAGDGMGYDNMFLDFGLINQQNEGSGGSIDIEEAFHFLEFYKKGTE